MTNNRSIEALLKERILVLDGAMGTMIQEMKPGREDFHGTNFIDHPRSLSGCNDILSLTRPGIIRNIHLAYLKAGADIITTNTFNANAVSLRDYGLEKYVREINFAAARIAAEAAAEFAGTDNAKPCFVAGCLGPTSKTLSMAPDVANPEHREMTFDGLKDIYTEQVRALLDGGVDILLVETVFDALNAKAALFAIDMVFEERGSRCPVMLSFTLSDASGRTLSGQTPEAFLISVSHFPLLSIGVNCSLGPEQLTPYVTELSRKAPLCLSVHPNAGLPGIDGHYHESPERMAAEMGRWITQGLVNIVGGCCGTTPDHIRVLAGLAASGSPRRIPVLPRHTALSGLEPLYIREGTNFINIGERTNVAGSRKFARLIQEQKYDEALAVARQQVENGASVLDVSMDDAMLDAVKEITVFLNLLNAEPDIARVPLMIDSSRWEVIEAGLKCLQGKAVVNSISLKEGEAVFLDHAHKIKSYGAAVVVMAFDEQGQATDLERKISILQRAYQLLTEKAGYQPADIIMDPNILTIATGMKEHANYALDYINALHWLKTNLPGVRTSGGISNLSFSFRGNDTVRRAMHSVFLYHAIKAGLDMGIVNAGELPLYDEIDPALKALIEDVIFNRRKDADERLISFAQHVGKSKEEVTDPLLWRENSLEERLKYAMMKGQDGFLEEDINEALKKYNVPLEIIEGPLMEAMNHVGELFGSGRMFLPQVVKSARLMKKAVDILLPYLEQDKKASGGRERGTVILATVRGDVHDIGKNIVGLVLYCNNFRVIDLGVMATASDIIAAAGEHHADCIGLSGLITPSLEEMIAVAQQMEICGLSMPLLIGGATTSPIHTAVRIAPAYSGPVVHVRDAGKAAGVLSSLISDTLREKFCTENFAAQQLLREENRQDGVRKKYADLEIARDNKIIIDWETSSLPQPRDQELHVFVDQDLETLIPFIDWAFFFHAWKLNGKFPAIFDDPVKGAEAKKLYNDAVEMLGEICEKRLLRAQGVFGIFPANASGDDILIYTSGQRDEVLEKLYLLRRQEVTGEQNVFPCLADYVAPAPFPDHLGLFAVSCTIDPAGKNPMEKSADDYRDLMLQTLAGRLAEAFAEKLHGMVRTQYWAYSDEQEVKVQEILRGNYSGIRPAPGYPACPDHSEKQVIFNLLDASRQIGIKLTETFSMDPATSVCGYYFAHPESKYFSVGKILPDQLNDYARRKNMPVAEVRRWISLNYSEE